MAPDHNIKTFTAVDIEKYHRGLLSANEMHDLEKAALDDPFLADALEGYAAAGVNVNDDIAELKKRLASRTDDKKVVAIPVKFNWLKIAAIFVLIAGAGYFTYQFGFNKENNIAQSPTLNKEKENTATNNEVATAKEAPATGSLTEEKNTTTTATTNKPVTTEYKKQEIAREDDVAQQNIPQSDTLVVVGYGTQRKKDMAGSVDKVSAGDLAANNEDKTKTKNVDGDGERDGFDKSAVAKSNKQANASQGFLMEAKQAPRNIFRGKITDSSNNPLPFANITNIADNVGTYADAKGNFILTSPDSVLNVQVRSIGFANNNTTLRNDVAANKVMMKEDYSGLTEVVIGNRRNSNSIRSRSNTMILEEPEPIDGWDNYDIYLANNLNEPESIRGKPQQGGEVEVSFEVNEMGEPINIKVERSLCESCDKEAIRLIKEGPKFRQKAKKGKRTRVTIPF